MIISRSSGINNPYNTKYTQKMTVERSEVITYSSPTRKPTVSTKSVNTVRHNLDKINTPTHVSQQLQIESRSDSMNQKTFKNDDDEFFGLFFCFCYTSFLLLKRKHNRFF